MTLTQAPALDALVADLDHAVRSATAADDTIAAVAAALRPALAEPDLLPAHQRVGDPAGYRQHLLHVPDDGAFSLVALVWLPGQATAIHDHLAWCVVGVHQGSEYETRYVKTAGGQLVEAGTAVASVGEVTGLLPPGDIHRVQNAGRDLAISLHVYGADIREVGSSIRRRYAPSLVRDRSRSAITADKPCAAHVAIATSPTIPKA
jgi:predicted metal-dependent enzyme (double-stranded beta helix superfamily)